MESIALDALSFTKFYDDVLDLRRREEKLPKRFNVWSGTMGHHVGRHRGFDFAFPNKKDNRMKKLMRQAEILCKAFGMTVVLVKRILEPKFGASRE